jgi:hypothetical protein
MENYMYWQAGINRAKRDRQLAYYVRACRWGKLTLDQIRNNHSESVDPNVQGAAEKEEQYSCSEVVAIQQERQQQAQAERKAEEEQAELTRRLSATLQRRKDVGDTVCDTSGNELGQVEQVHGNKIQIRTHMHTNGFFARPATNWDGLTWIDYNKVALCESN